MKIALLGYGTVGGGVYRLIENRSDMEVKYVLDLRDLPELGSKLVHEFDTILNDPEIDTVAEAMGGLHPSYEFASAALKAGKNYVTANKHLVCHYYKELTACAAASGASLRCTAAVGGGIPWLVNLARARRIDKITSITGIMNGTTNYIMDTMLHSDISFADALADAQRLGYAEANPAADIDGLDIQRKLIISSNVAFDSLLEEKDVPTFGIRNVTDGDIAAFRTAGYVCKLIATGERTADGIAAYVEPTLVTGQDMEAAVPSNFNLISYTGEYVGLESFFGQGAGRYPTACNVVQDCIDLLNGAQDFYGSKATDIACSCANAMHRYYVRTTATDPWLGEIAEETLGNGIITRPVSVAQMHAFAARAAEQDPAIFFAGIR